MARIDDRVLVEICERRFYRNMGPQDICSWLERVHGISRSREWIHKHAIPLAHRRGIFSISAPADVRLERRLHDRYRRNSDQIRVVNAPMRSVRKHVTREAASILLALIIEVGRRKGLARIGFGGGETMRMVAYELAGLLRHEPGLPRIALHAMSSGFAVDSPRSAPVTFMTFFEDLNPRVKCVGLFAPAVVPTRDYARVKRLPGVRESFAQAWELDILVTSLASAADKHGALRQFERVGRPSFRTAALVRAGWLADLAYYPYSRKGPIDIDTGVRAVTLFELHELKRFAERPDKHVIVVACPCSGCNTPKTEAVRPLLEQESLALWTRMVMDRLTAEQLMVPPPIGGEQLPVG